MWLVFAMLMGLSVMHGYFQEEDLVTVANKAFNRCWLLSKDSISVEIRVLFEPDGSVKSVGLMPEHSQRYINDAKFRTSVDAAIRAVNECSPYDKLPKNKYEQWKDMMITFNPTPPTPVKTLD